MLFLAATREWEEWSAACENCPGHSTCARRVGTLDYSCVCQDGYEDTGVSCTGLYRLHNLI